MKRILFVITTVLLFTSCQQEEFRIVEKSDCFKETRKRVIPDIDGFGPIYEAEGHRFIQGQRFIPGYPSRLAYFYQSAEPGVGRKFGYYDFDLKEGGLFSSRISDSDVIPAFNQFGWVAYAKDGKLEVEKENGDSLATVFVSGTRLSVNGWSGNGDTLYSSVQTVGFKSYITATGWKTDSLAVGSPFSTPFETDPVRNWYFQTEFNTSKIVVFTKGGDTVMVLEDPLGAAFNLKVIREKDEICWISVSDPFSDGATHRIICYHLENQTFRQVRKSGVYHGYSRGDLDVSPDGSRMIANWLTWRLEEKTVLVQSEELRIMTLDGCDERPLVLPEPQ